MGEALNQIAKGDPEVLEAVLDVMETEGLLESEAPVELLPKGITAMVNL